MISHVSHRLLNQGWTTPAGTGNADIYAAMDTQQNAAPSSAAAMANNASAAAGLGAGAPSFAAAMNAASVLSQTNAADGGDDETADTGTGSTADPEQVALAGPMLGHHHASALVTTQQGAPTSGTTGQASGSTAPATPVANALRAYQSAARGLH